MPDYQAVIFDMDGTIIESLLDFKAIRAELGIAGSDGIIEAIEAMAPARSRRCGELLLARETAAAGKAVAIEGAVRTVRAVRDAGLKTALLTRNAQQAMELVLERLDFSFDLTWSRQWGAVKPQPDGVLSACRALGVRPDRTVSVGDFRYDIEAANAAGAVSVLMDPTGSRDFAHLADHVIGRIAGLLDILELR